MLTPELLDLGSLAGALLRERGETVGVAEGSAGGLVSATLLAVPGASAYYGGGAVVYTRAAIRAFMVGDIEPPSPLRGATEPFARWLSQSVSSKLGTTWGIAEAGAAGPPNPYGDPAGHVWLAVSGPVEVTRHLLTGVEDRAENMVLFAAAALGLLIDAIRDRPS